jgi:glutamate 5-kinase
MRRQIAEAKRLVVKVGSALVTNNGQGLDSRFIADCARQIAALHDEGRQVLLVSSGAIAAGMQRLGWTRARTPCMTCKPPPPSARWAWPRPMRRPSSNTA